MKKYMSEMQALEKTRNENVIMLLGACLEENARLLVFEYACNDQYSRPLAWPERIKIAIGACRGLYYLHENKIIHGDMRPKKIWLTCDFEPLIAGFGLASMKNESRSSSNHCIIGTLGYLAPEYRERGKATTKTDVYAFGMILWQLVTGLSPTDTRLEGLSLIKWANSLVKEKRFSELIDPGIEYDINQMVNMMQLALNCVCKDPRIRLSMKEVMFALDYIKDGKMVQRADESQEVNGHEEAIGQSQRDFDEKVIYSYGGMTPLPKQAKHFYQGVDV
ncbi:receptor-like serine/threonine-protein kinase At1g78530 [Bidens hawaiensis]|uniref:receptor-like serine/threonine-protein kinase At1g78530 n=1 Tax=Bidens hawaiensis TaxID=980011 RepID=UPI0040493D33